MVVVGQVIFCKSEIYLCRCSWLQMYFPESFELFHRAGGTSVNVVDVKLDNLVPCNSTGIGYGDEAVTDPFMDISDALRCKSE